MLEGLTAAPFEPIEEVPEMLLTLKTIFLMSISSLKIIGDLQALLVVLSCLEFATGMVKSFLHPRQDYVLKVPTNMAGLLPCRPFAPHLS